MLKSQKPRVLWTAACFHCPSICVDIFGRNLVPYTTCYQQNETDKTCVCHSHLRTSLVSVLCGNLIVIIASICIGPQLGRVAYIFLSISSIFLAVLFLISSYFFLLRVSKYHVILKKKIIWISQCWIVFYPLPLTGKKSSFYPSLPRYHEETELWLMTLTIYYVWIGIKTCRELLWGPSVFCFSRF